MSLAIDAVDKIYPARRGTPVHAVRGLSLEVADGEMIALLGSSGCGKTSTLRMIAGFEDVSRGGITLAGRRIETLPPARRGVAMAFEGYALYPPLTVADNIGFGLAEGERGVGRTEAARRVRDVADMLEIGPILNRKPNSLSGGQQQRASLARALARDADLHLLDEPMGQLEPQLRAVLRGRVKAALRARGLTAVLVTHDQTEANAMADRIAVMEGGVLQQFAAQQQLKDRPANLFVATFVGEPPMNVFDAEVENGERLRFAIAGGPTLDYLASEIPQAVRSKLGARPKAVVGVRPHSVRLGDGPHEARVVSNQWLGDQTHVALDVAGKLLVAVSQRPIAARPGETLRYSIAAENLHLFDAGSGVTLSHGSEAA